MRRYLLDSVLVHARHVKTWGQEQRWVREFDKFAQSCIKEVGLPPHTPEQARASPALAQRFFADLVAQDRGRTVPAAARRALNKKRRRTGTPSLCDDEFVSMVVSGARRAKPKRRSQAGDLPPQYVKTLITDLRMGCWYDFMIAVIAALGLVTLMRLVELRCARIQGLRFVIKGNLVVNEQKLTRAPSVIKGMLIHVGWRKASQAEDAWIPVSCPIVISALRRHLQNMRKMEHEGYLFPSRQGRGQTATPHPANRIGSASFVKRLRALLAQRTTMPACAILKVRGHSLRVAGSNAARRQGVPAETHRLLGGWSSLVSSASYMAMGIDEQLAVTDQMALTRSRVAAPTREQAMAQLRQHLVGLRK